MKTISEEKINQFSKDGFLIYRSLFSKAEIEKLHAVALEDKVIKGNTYTMGDKSGKSTKLALWFTPGDDIYSLLTKSQRVLDISNALMEGDAPICHFHSKLMQKEPKVGGAWEWHQDYGYWYRNEFLLPNQLLSVMTAITKATKENGCLEVIKGSHKLGRVEHGKAGEQVGASQRYVDLALKTMDLVHVELSPGDVLFFHSNLLHRSAANLSDASRWSLITAYNRQSNKPYNEKSTACITPLESVGNDAILNADNKGISDNREFLKKETDVSLEK